MATRRTNSREIKRKKIEKSLLEYKVNIELTDVERAAHFLDWAAQKFPGRPVPATHVVRVALAEPRPPKEGTKKVEDFKKNRIRRVKQILFDQYQRALLSVPGIGYRATTGSEDVAETDQEKKVRDVLGAHARLDKSRSLIKRSEITGDVRKRFDRIGEAHKQLMSPAIQDRLRLPESKDK